MLRDHWIGTGKFAGVPPADSGYRIASNIWEQIGNETAQAYKTIPADFVGAMPDISKSKYKAEYWSFWILYMAPALLRGRFPNIKFYNHLLLLVDIIKICLQFEITNERVNLLEDKIIEWVEKYEKYVQF